MTDPSPLAVNRPGVSDGFVGGVAYITPVPAIVLLLLPPYNKRSFVRFHAWQSVLLHAVFAIVLTVAAVGIAHFMGKSDKVLYASFSVFIWVAWMLTWVLCSMKAMNGRKFKLPPLGNIAEKWAGLS